MDRIFSLLVKELPESNKGFLSRRFNKILFQNTPAISSSRIYQGFRISVNVFFEVIDLTRNMEFSGMVRNTRSGGRNPSTS
jgi:hypothetical protein